MAHNLLLDMRSLSINAVVYEHIGFYMNGWMSCPGAVCKSELHAGDYRMHLRGRDISLMLLC